MLIRSPLTGGGVSLGVALGVTLPFAVIIIFLMRLVLRSRKWKGATGREQLVGGEAEVTEALAPSDAKGGFSGMVRMHGELWRAVSEHAIEAGTRVRVTRVDGFDGSRAAARISFGARLETNSGIARDLIEAERTAGRNRPMRRIPWTIGF